MTSADPAAPLRYSPEDMQPLSAEELEAIVSVTKLLSHQCRNVKLTRKSITRMERDELARRKGRRSKSRCRDLGIMALRAAGDYRKFVMQLGTQKAKGWARWEIDRARKDRLESVRLGFQLP